MKAVANRAGGWALLVHEFPAILVAVPSTRATSREPATPRIRRMHADRE